MLTVMHVQFTNPLTYEEVLNWQGFAFETSRIELPDSNMQKMERNGECGMYEANRIMRDQSNLFVRL